MERGSVISGCRSAGFYELIFTYPFIRQLQYFLPRSDHIDEGLFFAGSQVNPTFSFLNILWSTSPSITVQWASHPLSSGSFSSARRQFSLCVLNTERATSTSSVCSLGLCPCRYVVLVCCIGSIISCGISFTEWSMPARCLMALSITAALE